ncbi:hypothetical protein BGW38_001149 [Lunasporangiospora selenospora]|uniref:Uncharacterized protein n=1 Tax=Lunasporangiospora selenospora TaxID=979761 RepID=A0A9P6KI81_9FUNG|nr:hypothetical protein BGW38_001149 [Lunasporangiospora selenospora]
MIAPVQNMLGKSMLAHITFSLALGGAAAGAFWGKIVLPNRQARDQYYVNLHANKA